MFPLKTTIGSNAFYGCYFERFTWPENVDTIESNMFYNNRRLTSITLPEGLKTIKSGAFAYDDLTEVSIPTTVETIESGAFSKNVSSNYTKNNAKLSKIINKTGKAFNWNVIVGNGPYPAKDPFIIGTVTHTNGNVQITAE